jgi:hypothetical protein
MKIPPEPPKHPKQCPHCDADVAAHDYGTLQPPRTCWRCGLVFATYHPKQKPGDASR